MTGAKSDAQPVHDQIMSRQEYDVRRTASPKSATAHRAHWPADARLSPEVDAREKSSATDRQCQLLDRHATSEQPLIARVERTEKSTPLEKCLRILGRDTQTLPRPHRLPRQTVEMGRTCKDRSTQTGSVQQPVPALVIFCEASNPGISDRGEVRRSKKAVESADNLHDINCCHPANRHKLPES